MRFVAVVKEDCPTCRLAVPALAEMRAAGLDLEVITQDIPEFPRGLNPRHDDELLESHKLKIEIVPTVIAFDQTMEISRVYGWNKNDWREITGIDNLGNSMPENMPGCGALNVAPGAAERLALKAGEIVLTSRAIEVDDDNDPMEVAFDRGWTDGLPVTPPTDLRVARMLAGTTRKADEVIGLIPPNLVPCTVEKAAVNAVMAGCRPEYFPVLLGAMKAALEPEFAMHGLLCTLAFSGPLILVNGPISRRIGMNSGGNALGQGNRANATIGRAFQLIIRNVGGGRPQEIDRACLGQPGKYTFCFAEDERDEDWIPLAQARGVNSGTSAVTLFHADGVTGFVDQKSRTAEELCESMAMQLWSVNHPRLARWGNAILVISPNHYEIFRKDGWGRAEIEDGLYKALKRPTSEILEGAGHPLGITPAQAEKYSDSNGMIDKFHPGGLLVVRAGGPGALMSAIIGGWTGGRNNAEVRPVTRALEEY